MRKIVVLTVNADNIEKLADALLDIAIRIKDGDREGVNNCKWWIDEKEVNDA